MLPKYTMQQPYYYAKYLLLFIAMYGDILLCESLHRNRNYLCCGGIDYEGKIKTLCSNDNCVPLFSYRSSPQHFTATLLA